MSSRDLKANTIRSLLWKLFEQGGTAVVTLVVQIVLARLLAPNEFGVLAVMLVFVNIGNVIVQSGLNTAIIQAPDASDKDYSTVFWMSFTISVVLYGALFLAAPAIVSFYDMPSALLPLRVLMLVLLINAYNAIQEAIVARELAFQKTFRATVVAGVVSGIAGIACALMGGGIWALVVQQLAQQGCKCLVLAIQVPWKPRFVFNRKRAAHFFRFGWKLLASGILEQLYQGMSDLIIGRVFSTSELGYVSQGKKYPYSVGMLLDGAIQPVMLSAVAHVQGSAEQVKRLARRALKTSTFLIVPSMVLFAVVAKPVVRLVLGEAWLPSVPFLQMYCIIYALLPIHTTNLQVLNGVGRSDLFLPLEVTKKVIGVVVLLFCVFILRNLYAIVGGYIVTGVISTFINASPNRRVIGYSYSEQLKDICPAFILAAVSACAALPIQLLAMGDVATIALQAIVMLVVYVVLAQMLHVEAYSYLINTLQRVVSRWRA